MIVTKQMLAGLMFVCIGLTAIAISQGYELGTLARFGPGYFPLLVGGAIVLLGLILFGQGFLARSPDDMLARVPLRPLLFIMLSVLLFGFLVDRAGLVVALLALIGTSWFASTERGPVTELVLIAAVLIAFAVAVFVYGLGIPFKLGPQ